MGVYMYSDKRGIACISLAITNTYLRGAYPATSIGSSARPPSVQVEAWSGDRAACSELPRLITCRLWHLVERRATATDLPSPRARTELALLSEHESYSTCR